MVPYKPFQSEPLNLTSGCSQDNKIPTYMTTCHQNHYSNGLHMWLFYYHKDNKSDSLAATENSGKFLQSSKDL